MAQFLAMDRPDAQPQVALNHLGRIRSSTSKEAAVVRFSVGKARYQQKRYDLAETCWKEALELDPAVPEAGWALIDLLDFEVRTEEAHRLGMRLFEVEPDPRDRVRLLLEMSRLDIDTVAPGSVVQVFEPVWRQHPDYLPLALAVGLALVHNSQSAEGIEVLHDALERHPDSAEAWDAWLTGLDDGHQPERLGREFARLPKSLGAAPRFARHEGNVAQGARDWPRAVSAYRRAYAFEPFNRGRPLPAPAGPGEHSSRRPPSSPQCRPVAHDLPECLQAVAAGPLCRGVRDQDAWARVSRTEPLPTGAPHSGSRWGGPTKPEPGTAWCSFATSPMMRSALPPWRGSSNMNSGPA